MVYRRASTTGEIMQPEVIKYAIIKSDTAEGLAREVQIRIENGWQPWGSIQMDHLGGTSLYVQPLVRYAAELT
jgi:hypothetical protein